MPNTRFFTETYTNGESVTVNESDGFSQLTLTVLSGTCTIQGNYRWQATNPGPISLSSGRTITLSSRGPGSPLDGITITVSNPGSVGLLLQP